MKFAQETVRMCSGSTVAAGWWRRITRSVLRLVGTKVKIVDIDMMLQSLGRPGEESW